MAKEASAFKAFYLSTPSRVIQTVEAVIESNSINLDRVNGRVDRKKGTNSAFDFTSRVQRKIPVTRSSQSTMSCRHNNHPPIDRRPNLLLRKKDLMKPMKVALIHINPIAGAKLCFN